MVAEIQGCKKGSLVHRFITSGKPGKCELCPAVVEKLEAHHLSYNPEITIKLCHRCHHKCHFWPNRLNDQEKLLLLKRKFGIKMGTYLAEIRNYKIPDLAKLIAPSRSVFIHKEQLKEMKRVAKEEVENPEKSPRSSHSPKVRNVNKQVDLSFIKRIKKPENKKLKNN